jgi:hypothetical protein
MTTISFLAAVGICAATAVAAAGDRAPTPVRLVGETCPQVAPPGARIERKAAPHAPRNVCLVFFAPALDE